MAAKIILPTDAIEVKQLCCLCYGQPGARKSSLAQTAENPITLAFDPGIYRAFGRKAAVVFDTWSDVVSFDMSAYSTIVVDTIGMALDKLSAAIIADNPKNGNRLGGLSLPGYGVLKSQFAAWVSSVRERGQSLVFLAHEKAEKDGDATYYCPDIVGGSYNTMMNHCDVVAYLHFESGKRVIDFSPTDRWMAKTPPCGWAQMQLPDFAQQPDFLAKLLAEAKASMGQISKASAEIAMQTDDLQARLNEMTMVELNEYIPQLATMKAVEKKRAWSAISKHAESAGWTFDKTAKRFEVKQEVA